MKRWLVLFALLVPASASAQESVTLTHGTQKELDLAVGQERKAIVARGEKEAARLEAEADHAEGKEKARLKAEAAKVRAQTRAFEKKKLKPADVARRLQDCTAGQVAIVDMQADSLPIRVKVTEQHADGSFSGRVVWEETFTRVHRGKLVPDAIDHESDEMLFRKMDPPEGKLKEVVLRGVYRISEGAGGLVVEPAFPKTGR